MHRGVKLNGNAQFHSEVQTWETSNNGGGKKNKKTNTWVESAIAAYVPECCHRMEQGLGKLYERHHQPHSLPHQSSLPPSDLLSQSSVSLLLHLVHSENQPSPHPLQKKKICKNK